MSNKKSKLGVISAVAAGTGTAIYLAQKAKKESGNSIFKKSTVTDSSVPDNYRNTERGKYDRNSKGIYYSNGNYDLPLWQRHVSLSVMHRCLDARSTF